MTLILDKKTKKLVRKAQQDEINSHIIYGKLAATVKNPHNAEILGKISGEELKHYEFWKSASQQDIRPQKRRVWFFYLISRFLGITFGIRLMERGEHNAQIVYQQLRKVFPDIKTIIEDEERHEDQLIDMLDEDLLNYVGSIVLGLSDALVELTGILAGFSLALQNTRLIALAGFIAGVSAAFSMAASEYLSASEEEEMKSPLKASLYTGMSYLFTVIILILPFFALEEEEPVIPLLISLISAVLIILLFTFYISVAKNMSFRKRFLKITAICLGVALFSLTLGIVARTFFHVEV
ncbi:MAG: VIT1/CCC1 transporter family protein [Candidatus Thorarchaeota archaeon]